MEVCFFLYKPWILRLENIDNNDNTLGDFVGVLSFTKHL